MRCIECKEESWKETVCINCGLVFINRPIVNQSIRLLNKKTKEKESTNDFIHPLSPDIQYSHIYPKRSKNPDLNRAFKKQVRESRTSAHNYYVRAYTNIKKYASILNLPPMITYEAINIYRCIVNEDKDWFIKYGTKPSYLAFIKIAAKIHEFPLNNRQFMELTDYKVKEKRTKAYMDKKFNKAYVMAKDLLNIHFELPEHPKYIDYVCATLKLPYECARAIHELFTSMKRIFRFEYKLEGYILALYYMRFKAKHNLTLNKLEKLFEVSRITIGQRRDEIMRAVRK